MLLVGVGRDEIPQFSLQFSRASTKCYLNTTGGLWFMLRGKRAMRRKKSSCVRGVFNPIYKYKYYYCIHIRSPLYSVIVVSSVNLQHMQTCCSECDVLIYIFSTFHDLRNVNGQQHTFDFLWTGSSLVAGKD